MAPTLLKTFSPKIIDTHNGLFKCHDHNQNGPKETMNRVFHKYKTGAFLIELLVVIAIIAILAGISCRPAKQAKPNASSAWQFEKRRLAFRILLRQRRPLSNERQHERSGSSEFSA